MARLTRLCLALSYCHEIAFHQLSCYNTLKKFRKINPNTHGDNKNMIQRNQKKYSIGEVSQISGLSIPALRFYDEKKLLVPLESYMITYASRLSCK